MQAKRFYYAISQQTALSIGQVAQRMAYISLSRQTGQIPVRYQNALLFAHQTPAQSVRDQAVPG